MVRSTDDGETTNIPGKHMASGSVPYSYRMRGKLLVFMKFVWIRPILLWYIWEWQQLKK